MLLPMQKEVQASSRELGATEAEEDTLSVRSGAVISGADLARTILNHQHGGVQAALRLAGRGECDWLECKSGMVSLPEERQARENVSDAFWHVAEAIIALANTRGGVVLVGVKDKTLEAVPLHSCDPRHVISDGGLEAYRRQEIYDRVNPANGEWHTGLKGIWRLDEVRLPDGCIEVIGLKYQEQDIAGILVHPVSECIRVWKGEVEQILRRAPGQVGKVESIKGSKAMSAYEATRPLPTADLVDLRDHFLSEVSVHDQDAELEAAISAYYDRLARENADLLDSFTPLDAEERVLDENDLDDLQTPVPREVYEPEAEEWFAPDEDWSRGKDDEDGDLAEYGAEDDGDDDLGEDSTEDDDAENDSDEDDEVVPRREPRRGGVFALLADEPRAVLLGEPGGGKTTCLKRLALDARDAYPQRREVVIYVPLCRWLSGGGLWGLIRRSTGLTLGQVERLIDEGRCRLLLDALNECPDALHHAAVSEIAALLRQHPALPVTVSARTRQDPVTLGLPAFIIQPLNRSQQEGFLAAYLRRPQSGKVLLDRIHAQPGGDSLAANPLLLRMIVEVAGSKGELPSGRAGLYRRWIAQWYRREQKKAKDAGFPLPWDIDTVRNALASIAFAARREGLRVAGMDLVNRSLAGCLDSQDVNAFVEHLTQGPLIQREDDIIRFRHETFQEYLCAEALLRQPAALADAGKEAYAIWGMSIAYAAELQSPLPKLLMDSVWRIEPWLGAILWEDGMPLPELDERLMRLIRWATIGESPKELSPQELTHLASWYKADDVLRYAMLSDNRRSDRWLTFEGQQLNRAFHPGMVQSLMRRFLYEGHGISSQIFKNIKAGWIKKAFPMEAAQLVKSGLLTADDFADRRDALISKAFPMEAAQLVKSGLLTADDFADRRDALISKAFPMEAAQLVKSGLLTADDFADRRDALISKASPMEAVQLVESGLLTADDFADRRDALISKASPREAVQLVKSGLLTADDFAERREAWVSKATPMESAQLVKSGLLSADDFAERREAWVSKASPTKAVQLVRRGVLIADDFADRREALISKSSPMETVQLVKIGLISADDFADRREALISKASPMEAVQLIKSGLISADDFAERREALISKATPMESAQLVKSGLLSADDFADRREALISKSSPMEAVQLVKSGLLSADDFAERREALISKASQMEAVQLVKSGLLSADDFAERRDAWISKASPMEAVQWVESGLLSADDFAERREAWISKSSPMEAVQWVKRGVFSAYDFAERRDAWISKASPMETVQLVKSGLLSVEDIAECRDAWMLNMPPAPALQDTDVRSSVSRRLDGVVIDARVIRQYGDHVWFLENLAFPDNIFCHRGVLSGGLKDLSVGDRVRCCVVVQENLKKPGKWGYVACDVKRG